MEDVDLRTRVLREERDALDALDLGDRRSRVEMRERVRPAGGLRSADEVLEDLVVLRVESIAEASLRDDPERLEQHAVVGRGYVADRLTEERLEADDAGGGHALYFADIV